MFYEDDFLTTPKTIAFYGAGRFGRDFLRNHCIDHRHIRLPDYVCDRDPSKWGSEVFGVPVVSPERLEAERPEGVIVVMTTCPYFVMGDTHHHLYYYNFYPAAALESRFHLDEMPCGEFESVRGMFADEKSRRVFDAMTRGQADGQVWFRDIYEPRPYFQNELVPTLGDGEVYVDAGAYLGGHVDAFAEANPNYRAVYAFEPHPKNFAELSKRFTGESRVKPLAKGLYDLNGQVAFADDDPVGAHVSTSEAVGRSTIQVVRLDDEVGDEVSYIKMDIEGAEMKALEGSRETILTHRPKLALCTYHLPAHYFEIPRFVHALHPDYRLYLRQHSPFNVDTVLYAIP